MQKKYWAFAVIAGLSSLFMQANASEFDQYLQNKGILNSKFKIQKKAELNELLAVLSAEDSKTLPLQIDQNTVIEQLQLTANKTSLKGVITTPDFAQFETDLGRKEVQKLIMKNLVQSCPIFFEHEYQKLNPYTVQLELSSEKNRYTLELKQKDCSIK
ncbi:hypothetical protein E2K73_09105 [Acinetobacter sp. RF15A]|uniref:hypothetical protein n=1 Tax=unclassified Acinetobacter TaxID=196816 RepID=UPI001190CE4A|nr:MULTISPECIES: hypothetical protein [unclassified Acinetobacter]TSH73974.1 hypothetical protein E2K73_09105 [Acinetobacter sp. RF15A]TSI20359.1 hypothetical protein E2K74_02670 [Acinetobacter sp. RF15B]